MFFFTVIYLISNTQPFTLTDEKMNIINNQVIYKIVTLFSYTIHNSLKYRRIILLLQLHYMIGK